MLPRGGRKDPQEVVFLRIYVELERAHSIGRTKPLRWSLPGLTLPLP